MTPRSPITSSPTLSKESKAARCNVTSVAEAVPHVTRWWSSCWPHDGGHPCDGVERVDAERRGDWYVPDQKEVVNEHSRQRDDHTDDVRSRANDNDYDQAFMDGCWGDKVAAYVTDADDSYVPLIGDRSSTTDTMSFGASTTTNSYEGDADSDSEQDSNSESIGSDSYAASDTTRSSGTDMSSSTTSSGVATGYKWKDGSYVSGGRAAAALGQRIRALRSFGPFFYSLLQDAQSKSSGELSDRAGKVCPDNDAYDPGRSKSSGSSGESVILAHGVAYKDACGKAHDSSGVDTEEAVRIMESVPPPRTALLTTATAPTNDMATSRRGRWRLDGSPSREQAADLEAVGHEPKSHVDRSRSRERRRHRKLVDSSSDEYSEFTLGLAPRKPHPNVFKQQHSHAHVKDQQVCGATHLGGDGGRHDSRLPMATNTANFKDMHVGAGGHERGDGERRAGRQRAATANANVNENEVVEGDHGGGNGGRRASRQLAATAKSGANHREVGSVGHRGGDGGRQGWDQGQAFDKGKEAGDEQKWCDGGVGRDAGVGRRTGSSKRPRERPGRSESPAPPAMPLSVTDVNSIPKYGLQYLIRTNMSSINNCGAHVFRIAPSIQPRPSSIPNRTKVWVGVQSYPQRPTCVSSHFMGRHAAPKCPAMNLAQILPQVGGKWMSFGQLNRESRASARALQQVYSELTPPRFLETINDESATRREVRDSEGTVTWMLPRSKSNPIYVYYATDVAPEDLDGLGRSRGDPDWTGQGQSPAVGDRLDNPRFLNSGGMARSLSTYVGINTNLCYLGTVGSVFNWQKEDGNLLSVSFLESGANKVWWFVPESEHDAVERLLLALMDPCVLKAAGMNVWKVLEQKAISFPATLFLKNSIRVYFHEMRVGDMVVKGPGGLHGGYNLGVNRASAVNYACLAWFEFGTAHAAEARRNQCQVPFPLEKLIVLSCKLLVEGVWWWGSPTVLKACDPDAFANDLRVLVTYVFEYVAEVHSWRASPVADSWFGSSLEAVSPSEA